jgi:MoxR-like ATPase
VPDDVKRLAVPALAHRVIVRTRAATTAEGGRADTSLADADQIIRTILQEVAVPR